MNRQGETIEKQLSDYAGYTIMKVTDSYGTKSQSTTYMAVDKDNDVYDCKPTLKELKASLLKSL